MTREEAISTLRNVAWLGTDKKVGQVEEALQMAITALQTDGDCISRQKALDDIETVDPSMLLDVDWVKNWVKALPSVQPEERTEERTETHACDCISREDVEQTVEDNILCYTHSDRPIDQDPDTECHMAIRTALRMLRKDLRKLPSAQPLVIHCTDCEDWYKSQNVWNVVISELPSVQPESCGDTISRQAAIDAIRASTSKYTGFMEMEMYTDDDAVEAIKALPSTQSEPKWIPCSERLPEETEDRYWVCTDGGYQCQCRWTNDVFGLGEGDTWTWKIFDIPQYSKVIAWMPLPEPYAERRIDG